LAELLFWPALFFYGEAAVGYLGEARSPGRPGWLATWGVRLGWLAQTGLLAAQAARNDGFPWGTWAASLNLFVWLVVSAYLIWGCRAPYRLLGLVVMPLAVALLVTARAGGGTGIGAASHYSTLFLVLHVGLVLAAFAGFTPRRVCPGCTSGRSGGSRAVPSRFFAARSRRSRRSTRLRCGRSRGRYRCSRSASRSAWRGSSPAATGWMR
jgi:hypothetical protein